MTIQWEKEAIRLYVIDALSSDDSYEELYTKHRQFFELVRRGNKTAEIAQELVRELS